MDTDTLTGPISDQGGRLVCQDHPDEPMCDDVVEAIRKNQDAPLRHQLDPWCPIWVSIFREVLMPAPLNKKIFFEVPVKLGSADDNGIAEVCFWLDASKIIGQPVFTLIGEHDGRYSLRSVILANLHAIVDNGIPPCRHKLHDKRYDKQKVNGRVELVNAYQQTYMGECLSCHGRTLDKYKSGLL